MEDVLDVYARPHDARTYPPAARHPGDVASLGDPADEQHRAQCKRPILEDIEDVLEVVALRALPPDLARRFIPRDSRRGFCPPSEPRAE
jgi:hypothetical protein